MKNVALFISLLFVLNCGIGQSPIHSTDAIHHPITGQKGMVASQHALATEVGIEILEAGGNAVDAAVAVGFALAVVLPRAGNLGGGGFMLVHLRDEQKTIAINYREMAPSKSHKDMYLNKDGSVDNELFNQSHLSTGVPGTVAGLLHALNEYGTMNVEEVIAPAIRLANLGFPVTNDLARALRSSEKRLRKSPESEKIFYKGKGYYEPGELLIQKDLAWSLQQISDKGRAGFYEGELAKRLSRDICSQGGIISRKDLKKYQVTEGEAVKGSYRGYEICSMPPPSSGGVHVIQMLNILERYPLSEYGHNSAQTIHLLAEAMRLAYADRSEHLGDPAFWDVPMDGLVSEEYADELAQKITVDRANDSDDILPGNPVDYESDETTHFSVVDKDGNVVSNTYTLNFSFGNGYVAKGTGILLNNEMGDFSAAPGTMNAFGLLGKEANAVEAFKRPLSSMTPTIVFKDGEPYLVTGSPGGSRIITTVLQVISNVIDHDMNIAEATHALRIHHQWYPDVLYYEKGLNADTRLILESKGHELKKRAAMGSLQSIMIKGGILYGASDPRRPDGLTKGL